MKTHLKKISLISTFLAACALPTFAENTEDPTSLADLLVEKGLVSREEVDSVKQGTVNSSRSQRITIKGETRVQYVTNMPKETKVDGDILADETDVSKFRVQAAALTAEADLGGGFGATLGIGLGGDAARSDRAAVHSVRILSAYASYTHSECLNFDAGFRGVPFGLEEGMSTSDIKTFMRTPANQFFDGKLNLGNRYTGLFVYGDIIEGLYYQAAVTNALVDDVRGAHRVGGESIVSSHDPALWAQLGYKDRFEELFYNFGGSIAYLPNQTQSDATDLFNAHQFGWNLFTRLQWQSLEVLAEFYASRVQDAIEAGKSVTPYGFSIIPSYKITEKVELVGAVSFVDAKRVPASRFDGRADDAAIPLISPSAVVEGASDDGVSANKVVAWYLGGNYYMTDAVKVTAGYQYAEFKERDLADLSNTAKRSNHTVGARLQLLF